MILAQALPPTKNNTRHLLKNYIGWKIGEYYITGRWKVIDGFMHWERQCSCGSEPQYVRASQAANGYRVRCRKCYPAARTEAFKEKAWSGPDNPSWRGHGFIPGYFFGKLKRGANNRARSVPVEITIEDLNDLWVKQDGLCAYTGTPLYFPSREKCGTASVDRIDSSKGYTIDNIQFVHKDVNLMKQALTEDRFLELCKMIAKHNA